jgi:hypothetical protein
MERKGGQSEMSNCSSSIVLWFLSMNHFFSIQKFFHGIELLNVLVAALSKSTTNIALVLQMFIQSVLLLFQKMFLNILAHNSSFIFLDKITEVDVVSSDATSW